MKLINLHAENLFSFQSLHIDFIAGLHLIRGYNYDENTANGAGKSAIIDIICWALYGETPRQVRLDEIIKWDSVGPAFARLTFIHAGHTYQICRQRRPSELILYVDSVPSVSKDARELQQKITNIIGLSLNTFVHSVYFPQDTSRADEFLFANDGHKKEILTEILGLHAFDEYHDQARLQLQKADIEKSNNEIELTRNRLSLAEKMALSDKYLKLSNEFKAQIKFDLETLERVIKEAEAKIDHASGKMAIHDNPSEIIKSNNQRLEQIRTLYPRLESDLRSLKDELSIKMKIIGETNADLRSVKNKITGLKSTGPVCEVCFQPVPDETKSLKLAEFNHEMEYLDDVAGENETAIALLGNKIAEIEGKRTKLQSLETSLGIQNKSVSDEFRRAEEEYQNTVSGQKQIIQNAIDSKTQLLSRTNNYEQLRDDVESECVKLENGIRLLEAKNAELGKKVIALDLLVRAFGRTGIRAMVFDNAVCELSQYINEYLSDLFVGDVTIDFVSEATRAGIKTVVTLGGKEINVNLLSGGQKRRLVLATNFAIARLIANRFDHTPIFVCLDECFTGLDVAGKEQVMSFLQVMAKSKQFIFVIDHATELQESFDSVYDVELRDGKSTFLSTYGN